jgi:hypothetical protein
MITAICARKSLTRKPERRQGEAMPTIIQLSPDGSGRYIAVDRDGQVWRGETKRSKTDGEDYIAWKPLHSEFPRGS